MKVYNSSLSGNVISNDAGKSTISREGFLKILAAELQNQDPLSSGDNNEYIAQMAQFSNLEQLDTLNTSMEKLLLSQKFQEGSTMIGKTAKIALDDGSYKTGEVSTVRLFKGKVYIVVDGNEYSIDDVVELSGRESEQDVVSDS